MSRPRRPREELEERLTSEYMVAKHPNARHRIRVRLGPLPPEAEKAAAEGFPPKMYVVVNHWADGIAIYPDKIVLIEAKLKLSPDALGQLQVYEQLLPKTPELAADAEKKHQLELIYVQGDPETEACAQRQGITCVRFAPDWAVQAYLERRRWEYIR
jgi:hypothetical protein